MSKRGFRVWRTGFCQFGESSSAVDGNVACMVGLIIEHVHAKRWTRTSIYFLGSWFSLCSPCNVCHVLVPSCLQRKKEKKKEAHIQVHFETSFIVIIRIKLSDVCVAVRGTCSTASEKCNNTFLRYCEIGKSYIDFMLVIFFTAMKMKYEKRTLAKMCSSTFKYVPPATVDTTRLPALVQPPEVRAIYYRSFDRLLCGKLSHKLVENFIKIAPVIGNPVALSIPPKTLIQILLVDDGR